MTACCVRWLYRIQRSGFPRSWFPRTSTSYIRTCTLVHLLYSSTCNRWLEETADAIFDELCSSVWRVQMFSVFYYPRCCLTSHGYVSLRWGVYCEWNPYYLSVFINYQEFNSLAWHRGKRLPLHIPCSVCFREWCRCQIAVHP